MTVYELNDEQLLTLKQQHLCELYDLVGKSPTWGELVNVDEIIDDETILDEYDGYVFSPDDF